MRNLMKIAFITFLCIFCIGCSTHIPFTTDKKERAAYPMAHFPKAYKLEDKIKVKLELYAMLDQRLAPIIEHPQTYPAILFQILHVNFETLGFVANYPQQKDKVISDTIGQVPKGEIPLLLQWDKRWGYGQYGDAFLGAVG